MVRRLAYCLIWAASLAGAQTAFADTLQSAVRTALTTNPSLRAATAEARASAYDLLKLQSEFQPVVSVFGEVGAQRVDDPASLLPQDNGRTRFSRQVGLDAELVLYDGQRRANLVYANAARVDGNIFRLLDASETMALNVTEVYIDLYRHLVLQRLAARNVARHREIGSTVSDLVEAGRLPLSDRLQVEDRIRAAQLAAIEVAREGRDAEARYERIVGTKRSGALSLPLPGVSTRSEAALIEVAVANSYRVRLAGVEVNRSGYEGAVIEADRKPRVSLNAGVNKGLDTDGVSGAQSDAFVGVRMRWTLYKGGRDAERNAWIERSSKARAEQHVAIRDVRELASRTWNSYVSNTERARLLAVQSGINRQLVEQYGSEFEAGNRSLLDVLDAERAAYLVEFEKVSADASLAFSLYRLLAAQSRLARHFGIAPSNVALIPNFEERALVKPTGVFSTTIPPLD